MLTLIPLPAFDDNYIWVWHDTLRALAVDPGDPQPLVAYLERRGLTLDAVLITHHHRDHTGGNLLLRDRYGCKVYAPDNPRIPAVTHRLRGGDTIEFPALGLSLEVIATPGHTLDHISYIGLGALFCGDAVFGCGCGRLFEGDAQTMAASLDALLTLPDDTLVCCAHEYTLANLAFARTLDDSHPALRARELQDRAARAAGRPTLPSTLALEKATNPFLRFHEDGMREFAAQRLGRPDPAPHEVFGETRAAKDEWDAAQP